MKTKRTVVQADVTEVQAAYIKELSEYLGQSQSGIVRMLIVKEYKSMMRKRAAPLGR